MNKKRVCNSSDCNNELLDDQKMWCHPRCYMREHQRAKSKAKKIENGAPWECRVCKQKKIWKGNCVYCEDCRPRRDNAKRRGPRLPDISFLLKAAKTPMTDRASSMAEAELKEKK